jgi:membrane-bound lytic murein transglycosylase D
MVPSNGSSFSEQAFAQDYRVRRGDSLHRIAAKFNISVSDIVSWNALDPTAYLQPGQKLTVYSTGG